MPGPEVLGGEAVARGLLHVLVDVLRTHVAPPRAVSVREQLVVPVAAALERPDDRGDLGVRDLLEPALTALGRVVEADQVARRRSRGACRTVASPNVSLSSRVVLGADAEEAEVEQPHGQASAFSRGRLPRCEVGRRRARAARAARARRPASRRTSRRRAGRASGRGSGTACGRRRRSRSPAGGPAGTGRSTRPPRPAGWRARGCARARWARRCAARRRRGTRSPCRGAGARCPSRSSRLASNQGSSGIHVVPVPARRLLSLKTRSFRNRLLWGARPSASLQGSLSIRGLRVWARPTYTRHWQAFGTRSRN